MIAIVDEQGAIIKNIDPFSRVELGLIQLLCGQTAEVRCSQLAFRMLPSRERPMTMQQTKADVMKFLGKPGLKMIPMHMQTGIRYLTTLLAAIENFTTHELKTAGMTKFVRECWSRCAFYLRIQDEDKEKAGGEAMQVICAKLQDAQAKNVDLVKEHRELLDKVAKFRWLVPPQSDDFVRKLLTTVDKEKKAAVKAKGEIASGSADGKAAKKQKVADSARDAAGAMFS